MDTEKVARRILQDPRLAEVRDRIFALTSSLVLARVREFIQGTPARDTPGVKRAYEEVGQLLVKHGLAGENEITYESVGEVIRQANRIVGLQHRLP